MAFIQSNSPRAVKSSSSENIPLSPQAAQNYIAHAQGLANDDDKYRAAVDLAKIDLQNEEKVTDSIFKDTIDTYYDQMNPEKTGREMRGENAWTDLVGGIKDTANGINTAIGGGIDWLFDNSVGNIIGLVNEDAGNKTKNFMTGEDLSIIPDIATDAALIASGIGIPVMLAKNAAQLSDYMNNAITGKDSITLEDLDGGQRIANAALGFGGTALSAIPGIGKGVNIAKTASKDAAEKAAASAAEKLDAAKALDNAINISAKGKHVPKETEVLKASDSIFANPKVLDALDKVIELGDIRNVQTAQNIADNAKSFLEKGTFGRVVDTLAKDTKGMLKATTVDVPGQVAKGFKEARDFGKMRGVVREANKAAKKSGKSPALLFEDAAKRKGLDVSKYMTEGETGGRVFSPPVRNLNPMQRAKIQKDARALANKEIDAMDDVSNKRKKKRDIRTGYANALTEAQNNLQPLSVSRISGLIPGAQVVKRGTQNSFKNVLDNIMRNSSSHGRALNDTQAKEFEEIVRSLTGVPKGEALSNQAKGVLGRIGSTGGGIASGFLAAPTAYYAQNGGKDWFDAGANMFKDWNDSGRYGSVLPMLLPLGTKSVSRRINPGLKGNLNSTIPHMAMRAPASAARMDIGDISNNTDNDGFAAALQNINSKKKDEEK